MPRIKWNRDAFGDFAEGFARFLGTARFLAYMTVFVILWIIFNVVGLFGFRWDPYPFILLNLFFSTQASYAAPLILLAQNRQEARDRVAIERDREQAAQSRADMDYVAREIAGLRMSVGRAGHPRLRTVRTPQRAPRDPGRAGGRRDHRPPTTPRSREPQPPHRLTG